MSALSEDEYTVLLIAAQGEYLAPIGWWEKPVRDLAVRGLLQMLDSVNFVITDAGRQAAQQEDQKNDQAIAGALKQAASVQGDIRDFAEQAANLLAAAGKASAGVTGDAPSVAVDKWSEIIRKRARELL